jgi:hypothetical protein
MTFYTALRDNTAGPLITQFGAAMTLTKQSETFNPNTGTATLVDVSTQCKGLEISLAAMLRGGAGKNQYDDELVQQWDSAIILSAKELAAAGVEPEPNDVLVVAGRKSTIKWVEPVRPAGVAVIYKCAIARF